MLLMWILIGLFIWTIVSIAYTFTNFWKMFDNSANKTPWYEFIFYPPLLLIAITIDLLSKLKKK